MTGNREIRDEVVRIASLVVTNPHVTGYTFVNCKIVGPAVLGIIEGVEMNHCVFEADINSIFWEVDPATRPTVYGIVGISNCQFVSCRFEAIGFAGTKELRQVMESAVS